MLKIEVSGGTLKVRWQHNNNDHLSVRAPKKRKYNDTIISSSTKCIMTLVNGKDEVLAEVEGETNVYYKDNYCKETGRKVSLKKVIINDSFSDFPILTEADKKLVYDGYLNRKTKMELV